MHPFPGTALEEAVRLPLLTAVFPTECLRDTGDGVRKRLKMVMLQTR